ncbi:hypothetical protein [Erythrobacter sp. F6033]|uniref:hypothetical protein n=1 Tax=Erythrobacter sp. F6033 TaxID=2926401 RepID=UPI001FF4F419|nr:hypothetical protein [Erythrobacter sp. F6033]MCK0129573.1 hypothetical protein [Erythrobacter sp. F6033]
MERRARQGTTVSIRIIISRFDKQPGLGYTSQAIMFGIIEEETLMKKFTTIAMLGTASLALAACGSSDDASNNLEVETVEMPAEEALEPVAEEPVEDTSVAEVEGPPPVDTATAEEAAEAAAGVAEAVEAAEAAEAALAAEAAEAAANIEIE